MAIGKNSKVHANNSNVNKAIQSTLNELGFSNSVVRNMNQKHGD
jgi:hypothetical protein